MLLITHDGHTQNNDFWRIMSTSAAVLWCSTIPRKSAQHPKSRGITDKLISSWNWKPSFLIKQIFILIFDMFMLWTQRKRHFQVYAQVWLKWQQSPAKWAIYILCIVPVLQIETSGISPGSGKKIRVVKADYWIHLAIAILQAAHNEPSRKSSCDHLGWY